MANEISLTLQVSVTKGNLSYRQANSSRLDMAGENGPTPGSLSIPTSGLDVSFSQLTTPGLLWLCNLDDDNYVTYGIHDGAIFHPIGELPPGGVPFLLYLSRDLGEEQNVSGTGTTGVVNTLHLKANTAACIVRVEAFES